jgi:hypothetical protein
LNSSIKSEIGVSSFCNCSGSRIAEVGDGSGKDSGSANWDSSSNNFSLSLERSCKIFHENTSPLFGGDMHERTSCSRIKILYYFSSNAHEEVLEKNRFWNGKVRTKIKKSVKAFPCLT